MADSARTTADLLIRPADHSDKESIAGIITPVLRAGETYAFPPNASEDEMLSYWVSAPHSVLIAMLNGMPAGTYFIQPNQRGGGSHVANCGYETSAQFSRLGVATAMCRHSIAMARELGFEAMQFNFVVACNQPAINVWKRCGFEIVGRTPSTFLHPRRGYVDVLIMHRCI